MDREELQIKQEQSYQIEIERKKPCWFDQFAVYSFEKENTENIVVEKPKVSERVEKNWQSIMKESIDNEALVVDLDVSVSSRPAASRSSRLADVPFEVL